MSDRPRGVFAGLATLDVVHRVDRQPASNEKVTAQAQFVAAGGPAANAAVTFAALGGKATLLSALGTGPVARMVEAELAEHGVTVIDMAPELTFDTPVSSVTVIAATGDRSVVGGDAAGLVVPAPAPQRLADALADHDVVLLDGHHPEVARAVAAEAHRAGIPTVLDAGRWKPVIADLLKTVTDVVASADFRTPGATTSAETADRLVTQGVPVVVTTAGGGPVRWWADGQHGDVAVPAVQAVDTLGAGDVFHGAWAFALASGVPLQDRIRFATAVAGTRCAHVGPRSWLAALTKIRGIQ